MRGTVDTHRTSDTWLGFVAWAVVGVVVGFALVMFGAFAGVPILVGLSLAAAIPALRRSWFGFLVGVGMVSLFFAFLDRRGPGTICWRTARAAGCDQYGNPWPWLVAGVALVLAGCAAQALRERARAFNVR